MPRPQQRIDLSLSGNPILALLLVTSCEPAPLRAQVGRLGNHAAANVLGNLDGRRDSGPLRGGSLFCPWGLEAWLAPLACQRTLTQPWREWWGW